MANISNLFAIFPFPRRMMVRYACANLGFISINFLRGWNLIDAQVVPALTGNRDVRYFNYIFHQRVTSRFDPLESNYRTCTAFNRARYRAQACNRNMTGRCIAND